MTPALQPSRLASFGNLSAFGTLPYTGRANNMTAPSMREPRKPHCILKQFGGCGSKSGAETGICAFGGAPSSEQGEFRGRPPLANATLSPPAPPLPTNLLLCKIFAGALPSAHRAVQFAPCQSVILQFARKPFAPANASTLKSLSYSCNAKRSRPKSTPFSVAQRQGLSSPLSTNQETRLF